MRFDTCRQCVRRRIRCDGQSPECAKCLKKGITCSGVGKQYRFVKGHDPKIQSMKAQSLSTSIAGRDKPDDESGRDLPAGPQTLRLAQACHRGFISEDSNLPYTSQDLAVALAHLSKSSLQPIDADRRMLFDYCECPYQICALLTGKVSSTIAPAMVVFDVGMSNGYRNIFLPLAMEDDLVQRAVSVCSAFHIGKKQPEKLEQAERDRTAIIQKLRHDALHSSSEEIFSISVWATIILLLVAETVTGQHEFTYLFNMLQSLVKNTAAICEDQKINSFLIQQTQMFNLFTPLFLGPEIGLIALEDVDAYMDFIPAGEGRNACHVSNLLRLSIYLARDIYLAQVNDTNVDVELLVEKLILLLVSIDEQPGMHAFVWPYFVAAATTKNPDYRLFFVNRLRQIYNKTGMHNILVSINMLEKLWELPAGQNWTRNHSILQQALVM